MSNEPEKQIHNSDDLQAVIDRISFDRSTLDFKWRFRFSPATIDAGKGERAGWLIWAEFERPDIHTGQSGIGRGRDEIIWQGTTLSGVVKTCYVLVDMLIRHELMEGFRFDGVAPFNPHNTIPQLVDVSRLASSDNTYGLPQAQSE